ncbi:MAG: ribosome-associated translation inhibitor RaiA [Gammaproteobacteria bacterium]|nr:ribosome-associated translation inhibitor RaiA [Gammaproteobacteria bacterium]
MQLSISGHHLEITDSLRNYAGSKLSRLERHFDHVTDIHCILSVEKLQHKAEAKINVNGSTLFADSVEDNMYAAIDTLVDKLDRQIKKHKEKLKTHYDKHDPVADKRTR